MATRSVSKHNSRSHADTAILYALVDPRVSDPVLRIRYIGVTKWPPERRRREHIRQARSKAANRKQCWIRSLLVAGVEPDIIEIREVPIETAFDEEIIEIAISRKAGCPLVNSTDGGRGILNPTDEVRKKIGEASRGRQSFLGCKHTEETKARMKKLKVGHRPTDEAMAKSKTPEAIAKMAQSLRDRVWTTEELERHREHARKHLHSPKAKEKMRQVVRTKEHREKRSKIANLPHNIERMRKLGKSHKGRKLSVEHVKAIVNANTGRKHTEESKNKIRDAQSGAKSHRAKFTWEQVGLIRKRYAAGGLSQNALARELGVTPRTINLIVNNKTWIENADC